MGEDFCAEFYGEEEEEEAGRGGAGEEDEEEEEESEADLVDFHECVKENGLEFCADIYA